MPFPATITCCCCKTTVPADPHLSDQTLRISGWVRVDRKPFCGSCLKEFTEEDWDWLSQAPLPLALGDIPQLIRGNVEPL